MAKKKLNSVIGIDIGSQNIKVAELKSSGRDLSISALGLAPTPEGMVDHTGVYDTDNIAAVVKHLCATTGCSVNQMVISVAGQASVLVRTLEVPRMNPNELKDHMAWEISRNIPFAESTVVSDYKAFDPADAAAQNLDVVMAIAPQSAVETLMGIAKKAAKQVHALDVEPLGIARCLTSSYGNETQNETVCVIEIGHKTTAINVYKNGQLLMPRQVPVGGEQFTSAIANGLGVTMEDAERIKIERAKIPAAAAQPAGGFGGFAAPAFDYGNPFADTGATVAMDNPFAAPASDNPFAETSAMDYSAPAEPSYSEPSYGEPAGVEPVYGEPAGFESPLADAAEGSEPTYASPFSEEPAAPPVPEPNLPAPADDAETTRIYNAMATEVDEFVAEVRRSIDYFRSKGGDVHRILLAGGGSKLRGLDDLLERVLSIKTEIMDPFKGMAIAAKKLEYGVLEDHRPDFTVAVGNSLHIVFE